GMAVQATAMRNGRKNVEPVVYSTNLSADDWSAFAPGELTVGKTWTIPATAVGKLVPVLSPMTDAIFTPQPKDATRAELTAKVERMEGGRALIRLSGRLESAHNRDGDPKFPIRASATLDGLAEYDTASKGIR